MYINTRHQLSPLLILVVFAGCEWDYPLSQPEDAVAEAKLFGVWKLDASYDYSDASKFTKTTPASDELSILKIMKAPEENIFILGFTELHKPQLPSDKRRTHYAWVTKIGDIRYLNVGSSDLQKPAGGEKNRAFSVVKYELSDNKLQMYGLNRDARTRISSFVGDFYDAATIRQQLTAGENGDWQIAFEFTRMR